jgi:hypothetical protein
MSVVTHADLRPHRNVGISEFYRETVVSGSGNSRRIKPQALRAFGCPFRWRITQPDNQGCELSRVQQRLPVARGV